MRNYESIFSDLLHIANLVNKEIDVKKTIIK